MTKAIMCTTCGQIVGPRPRSQEIWSWCAEPCIHSAVRWRDGAKGLLEVTSLHGPEGVVVIGLHNGFIGALPDTHADESWRRVHEAVTNAPGYLFDKSKRDCWAVLTRVGQSNDVFFMPYQAAWNTRPTAPVSGTHDPIALTAPSDSQAAMGPREGQPSGSAPAAPPPGGAATPGGASCTWDGSEATADACKCGTFVCNACSFGYCEHCWSEDPSEWPKWASPEKHCRCPHRST